MKSKASKKEGYSIGFLRFSKEFKAAAKTLGQKDPQGDLYGTVPHYLFCHALELLIKAYLKTVGHNDHDLKTYGHDLEKLLRKAKNGGLDKHVALSNPEVRAISKINPYYKEKQLEYLVPIGPRSFPSLTQIESVLDRLYRVIEPLCKQDSALKAKNQIQSKKSLKPTA
jgi:hypothetical protein